jgi:hypothetical protein
MAASSGFMIAEAERRFPVRISRADATGGSRATSDTLSGGTETSLPRVPRAS